MNGPVLSPPVLSPPVLSTAAVSKSFGGLQAVRDVTLDFETGRVDVVIGPNGAGKTTLINLLSGDLTPTSGSVVYRGQDITAMPPHRISQLGLGRSYQRTNIFPEFTCYRNVWLAAQSRMRSSMRFFRPASSRKDVAVRADRAIELAGLTHRARTVAANVSHGEQRQLEVAMLLATEPEALLLDEPLAGMGAEETENIVELIRTLKATHCVVLIEHDMDAVFAVADQLTVMVNGTVLETGPPEQIRSSETVREAYLGDEMI